MNLSQVTTPAELLEQNSEATPPSVSRLDALVEELDLNETYELALTLVQRLGSFHQSVVEQEKEEAGDLERLVVWAQDEQLLHNAYDLIKQVSDNE